MLFLQDHQRDTTEYGYGRQYQAQCHGLTEENDATQGRNDRNTELHCPSLGGFQRRQCRAPNGVPDSRSQEIKGVGLAQLHVKPGGLFAHGFFSTLR